MNMGGFVTEREDGSGNSGLRPSLRDPWASSSRQIGHFLTGVGHRIGGLSPILRAGTFVTSVVNGGLEGAAEDLVTSVDVGHESLADGVGLFGKLLATIRQLGTALAEDVADFNRAVENMNDDPLGTVDIEQALRDLSPVIARMNLSTSQEPGREGNSVQDLLLTALGHHFGNMIKENRFENAGQAAAWLRVNLGTHRSEADAAFVAEPAESPVVTDGEGN